MTDVLRLENRHTGEVLRLRRVRERDGRVVLMIEGSLPPGTSGPPPHIHWQQQEEGKVIAGKFGARRGTETILLGPGEPAVFPAGVVHSWWNAGNDMLEAHGKAVPAGDLDRFLEALFAVINAGPSGRPPMFYLAHVLWRHRDTQTMAVPPRIVQRVLFPLVVMIGRLLGKYRGAEWPGCPASCTGAPEATVA